MRHIGVVLPVVFAFLVGAAPASAWTWPVEGPVMQPFSFGGDPYAGGQHRGIDVGAASNAPVRAPAAGLVSFAGSVPAGGLTVTIRTDDGYAVTLVHLGTVAVGRGQQVLEGDVVGAVGPSGEAEQPSPYVHLGIRVAADEHGYVDPLTVLPARPGVSSAPADVALPRYGRRGCGRRSRRHTPARAALLGSRARASIGGGPDRGVQRGRRHRRIVGAERASRRDRIRVERGRCRRRPGADGAGGLRRDRRVGPGRGRGDSRRRRDRCGARRDSAGGGIVAAAGADLPAVGVVPVRAAHPSASRRAVQEAAETRPGRASGPANGAETRHRGIATRRGGQGARPQVMKPDASPAAPIRARDEAVQAASSAGGVESAGRTDRDLLLGKAAALAAVLAGAALLLWRRAGGARPAPAADPAQGSPGGVREAKAAVDRHAGRPSRDRDRPETGQLGDPSTIARPRFGRSTVARDAPELPGRPGAGRMTACINTPGSERPDGAGRARPLPMIGADGSEFRSSSGGTREDPRRRGLAVRERAPPHRPRRRVRRAVRHLRPVPPAAWQ